MKISIKGAIWISIVVIALLVVIVPVIWKDRQEIKTAKQLHVDIATYFTPNSGGTIVGKTEYEIIVIDSCEYIYAWFGSGNGGGSLTHKGNCKFCKNRK